MGSQQLRCNCITVYVYVSARKVFRLGKYRWFRWICTLTVNTCTTPNEWISIRGKQNTVMPSRKTGYVLVYTVRTAASPSLTKLSRSLSSGNCDVIVYNHNAKNSHAVANACSSSEYYLTTASIFAQHDTMANVCAHLATFTQYCKYWHEIINFCSSYLTLLCVFSKYI